MSNPYGYNVLNIPDKAVLLAHLRRLNPPAILFFQREIEFARLVAKEFPNMIVIIRHWPDSDTYKHMTPKQWINVYESAAQGGLYLQTTNESGLDSAVITWHLEVMHLAVQRGIHLCLLNPATGTWDTSDYPVMRPVLELAGRHRDLFIVCLHTYAGGVITSGIAGGYPSHAGVDPNGENKDKGRNLIPRENWPRPVTDTTFHIGRHNWVINYCRTNNIPMPRFALTECGFDYLGDIGAWLNTLDHSGFDSVNGWHTLRAQWNKWFGISGEQAYFEQLKYAAENLLQGVDFALLYALGDDGNWPNYNVANSGLPALLEGLNTSSIPPANQPPQDTLDKAALLALVTSMKDELVNAFASLNDVKDAIEVLEDTLK